MRARWLKLPVHGTLILFLLAGFTGCWKKSGMAEVLEKEYIAAAEPSPTPPTQESPTPAAENPDASPTESPDENWEPKVPPDEIVVDGVLMKKDVRGTGRDPRAQKDERWIVKLQMVSDQRQLTASPDKARWEKLKVGDRVKVTYKEGKYTGSIWSVTIE